MTVVSLTHSHELLRHKIGEHLLRIDVLGHEVMSEVFRAGERLPAMKREKVPPRHLAPHLLVTNPHRIEKLAGSTLNDMESIHGADQTMIGVGPMHYPFHQGKSEPAGTRDHQTASSSNTRSMGDERCPIHLILRTQTRPNH